MKCKIKMFGIRVESKILTLFKAIRSYRNDEGRERESEREGEREREREVERERQRERGRKGYDCHLISIDVSARARASIKNRSEERRVGKECW